MQKQYNSLQYINYKREKALYTYIVLQMVIIITLYTLIKICVAILGNG